MSSPTAPFALDPEALKCPYPHFEEIRRLGRAPFIDDVQAHVVTGYSDICDVMRRPGVASSRTPTGPVVAQSIGARIAEAVEGGLVTEAAAAYLTRPHDRTLFTIDPPEHTRQRRVVARFFAPFKVVSWEPMVRQTAERLVDEFVVADPRSPRLAPGRTRAVRWDSW